MGEAYFKKLIESILNEWKKYYEISREYISNKKSILGITIFAALFENQEKIESNRNEKYNFQNSQMAEKHRHKSHAEYLVIQKKYFNPNYNYHLIISLEPCKKCLSKISEIKANIKVLYLYSNARRKNRNKEKNIKIERINAINLFTKESKEFKLLYNINKTLIDYQNKRVKKSEIIYDEKSNDNLLLSFK